MSTSSEMMRLFLCLASLSVALGVYYPRPKRPHIVVFVIGDVDEGVGPN